MPSAKHDLETLGLGPDLIEDLGVPVVPVEIAAGDTVYVYSEDAWAATFAGRPKKWPDITPQRPATFWFEPAPGQYEGPTKWNVMQYNERGIARVDTYDRAFDAKQRVTALYRTQRDWFKPKKPPPVPKHEPTLKPKLPVRCICGQMFYTTESILAHDCKTPRARGI